MHPPATMYIRTSMKRGCRASGRSKRAAPGWSDGTRTAPDVSQAAVSVTVTARGPAWSESSQNTIPPLLTSAALAVHPDGSAAMHGSVADDGTACADRIMAWPVPSSAMLPCIAALPSGWTEDGADTGNGRVVFWLDSDQGGPRAVTVTLTAACNTSGAVRVPSDEPGAARYERPLALQPRFMLVRMYTVAGGCVTYQFSFATGAAPSLAIFVDEAIAFEPRSVLVASIRHSEGLALCGRGAACPG